MADRKIEAAAMALCGLLWSDVPWARLSEATRNWYREIAKTMLEAARNADVS